MKIILALIILFWAVGASGAAPDPGTLSAAEQAFIESAYQGQLERLEGLAAKVTSVDAADDKGNLSQEKSHPVVPRDFWVQIVCCYY